MARDLRPKSKQERREGTKLFLKGEKNFSPKNPIVKRPYPPGVHGPAKAKFNKLTGFGIRLREKQKAKRTYRLLEKDFHKYFVEANRQTGDTQQNLIKLLEKRLDNVVYRLGLADSRDQARQLVNHAHFLVNNKKVSIPSLQIKVGDIIKVREQFIAKKFWEERLAKLDKVETPGWVSLDAKKLEGKVVTEPTKEDLNVPFDLNLIIEFYSR